MTMTRKPKAFRLRKLVVKDPKAEAELQRLLDCCTRRHHTIQYLRRLLRENNLCVPS